MIDLTCPHCGGAISAQIGLNPGSTARLKSGPNPAQISDVESDLSISLEPSPKKERVYNQGYDQGFLEFWDVYPLHRGKRKAQIAWLKSVKRLAQISGSNLAQAKAQIFAAAVRYRDDPNRVAQFTKYAEGWLNGDRWEDEELPERASNGHGRESAAMRILRESEATGGG